jgi:hypothetical protein
MKKIAILAIAAINQPLYVHYIKTYWTELIRYANDSLPNIDVYLLLEKSVPMDVFADIRYNTIQDEKSDFSQLCDAKFHTLVIPGILSKTIYALELLQDRYDVFFRTNLSSLIRISSFDRYVQSLDSICYSGAWVWADGLRQDLVHNDRIGPDKSIKTLAELDGFEGNTFISGAGYFLSSAEARSLVRRKEQIRYDIIDDVSVGLMLGRHEVLHRFATTINPDQSADEIMDVIRKSPSCHFRLQHFPLSLAEALWERMKDEPLWK